MHRYKSDNSEKAPKPFRSSFRLRNDAKPTKLGGYELHPFVTLFPPMSPDELELLTSDIRENGLLDPITLCQGKVLDGRNRLRACKRAGVKPRFEELPEGEDPLKFVISKNAARRNLNPGQRAMVAEALATGRRGGDRRSRDQTPNSEFEITVKQAAKLMAVSASTVYMARKVRETDSDMAYLVRRGMLSLNAAHLLVNKAGPATLSQMLDISNDGSISYEEAAEKLEELASSLRTNLRRLADSRTAKAGAATREAKSDRAINSLIKLAMSDSPNLLKFRKALKRVKPTSTSDTEVNALRALIAMLDQQSQQIATAKLIVEKYISTGATVSGFDIRKK